MAISLERGAYSAALGLAGSGAIVVWPEQWWIGVGLVVAGAMILLSSVRINGKPIWRLWGKQFPERHREILLSLADPLARFEHLALGRAYWNPQSEKGLRQEHFQKFADARVEAERLIAQIPYDQSTVETARDFMQACSIAAHDAQGGGDDREARSDVHRISPGLFRFLHDGRSINRKKVDLPDWCRTNEGKKEAATSQLDSLRPPASPPPEASSHGMPPIEEIRDLVIGGSGRYFQHDPIGDAFRRLANQPSPPPKRDTGLGEAILYVLKGKWGLDFSTFNPHKDSHDLETIKWQFEERAEDGSLQVWGSDLWVDGRYTKLPADDWKHLKIEWQSLTEGEPRTTEKSDDSQVLKPHYNLMVNKAQVEREFPRIQVGSPSTPPQAPVLRPRMGTPGAFVRGVDEAQTVAGVEIHNYGSSTAQNVSCRSLCAILPRKPEEPVPFDKTNFLGPCEPGHTQNIRFPFLEPVGSQTVARLDRHGGMGLYLLMEVDYEDGNGKRFRREIAYYLDPMAEVTEKGLQMSVCAEGNGDIEIED